VCRFWPRWGRGLILSFFLFSFLFHPSGYGDLMVRRIRRKKKNFVRGFVFLGLFLLSVSLFYLWSGTGGGVAMPRDFWIFVGSLLFCGSLLFWSALGRGSWKLNLRFIVAMFVIYGVVFSVALPANSAFVNEMRENAVYVEGDYGDILTGVAFDCNDDGLDWRNVTGADLHYLGNGSYVYDMPEIASPWTKPGFRFYFVSDLLSGASFDRMTLYGYIDPDDMTNEGDGWIALFLMDSQSPVCLETRNFDEGGNSALGSYYFNWTVYDLAGDNGYIRFLQIGKGETFYCDEDAPLHLEIHFYNDTTSYAWYQPDPEQWRVIGVASCGLFLAGVTFIGIFVMASTVLTTGRKHFWMMVFFFIFFLWCCLDFYAFYSESDSISFQDQIVEPFSLLLQGEQTNANIAASVFLVGWAGIFGLGALQTLWYYIRWRIIKKSRKAGKSKKKPVSPGVYG